MKNNINQFNISEKYIIRETIIEKYSRIGKFDFVKHFQDVKDFYEGDYNNIFSYYSSNDKVYPILTVEKLRYLKEQQSVASQMFRDFVKMEKFITLEHFELQEIIDGLSNLILFMENCPKYLRVSHDNVYRERVPMMQYKVKQNDTLESIALKFYGDQEKWKLIAEQNQISYYEVGGVDWINTVLNIRLDLATQEVIGIVDVPIGEDMLGKEICKEFAFKDDDIELKEGVECFEQSVEIMLGLTRGSIPENYNIGHLILEMLGNNLSVFNNLNIINEIQSLFNLDPTVYKISVDNVIQNEDAIFIDFVVVSINGYKFNRNDFPINF